MDKNKKPLFETFDQMERSLRGRSRIKSRPRRFKEWGWSFILARDSLNLPVLFGSLIFGLALFIAAIRRWPYIEIGVLMVPLLFAPVVLVPPLVWILDKRGIIKRERERTAEVTKARLEHQMDRVALDKMRDGLQKWSEDFQTWRTSVGGEYALAHRLAGEATIGLVTGLDIPYEILERAVRRFDEYRSALIDEQEAIGILLDTWQETPTDALEQEIVSRVDRFFCARRRLDAFGGHYGLNQRSEDVKASFSDCTSFADIVDTYQCRIDEWIHGAQTLLDAIPEHPPWLTHEEKLTSPYRGEVTGVRVALVDEAPATVVEDDGLDGDASAQAASTTLARNAG
ncbi:MAG: hypothetical protein WCV84_03095 [Patescibacteria group bacterium]